MNLQCPEPARLRRAVGIALMLVSVGLYLYATVRLIDAYPFEWISSTYVLPSYELAQTGSLTFQYQLFYADTDRMYANPPLYYMLLALVFKIFGAGVLQVRILAIALNLAMLVAVFLLVRTVFSSTEAVASVIVLTLTDFFFSYSFCARPTQLALVLFLFSLVLCARSRRSPEQSSRLALLAGLLMGLGMLAHFYIASFGLLVLLTLIPLPRDRSSVKQALTVAACFGAGVVLPLAIYFAWVGRDLARWLAIQKVLSASDATGGSLWTRLADPHGMLEDVKYLVRYNFLDRNLDLSFDPYWGQAIHRKYAWLGFSWATLYKMACAFGLLRVVYHLVRRRWDEVGKDMWLLSAGLAALLSAGILYPKGVGNEYIPPIYILLAILIGVMAASLARLGGSSRVLCVSSLAVVIYAFTLVLLPRGNYTAGLMGEMLGEPGYAEYMAPLRQPLAQRRVAGYMGPHFANTGLLEYPYFDYFALKDKSGLGIAQVLLSQANILVTYDTKITFSVVFNPIAERLIKAGFYQWVACAQSRYYGRTSLYARESPPRSAPFTWRQRHDGDRALEIDARDGEGHAIRGLFVKGPMKVASLQIRVASSTQSPPTPVTFTADEIEVNANGILLVPRSSLRAARMCIEGFQGPIEQLELASAAAPPRPAEKGPDGDG